MPAATFCASTVCAAAVVCRSGRAIRAAKARRIAKVGSERPPAGRPLLRCSVLEQLERPERPAGRDTRDVGIGCDQRVDAAGAAPDRDELLAVLLPRDGLTGDAGRSLELPENFSGLRIDRDEFAGELAGEDQPARGHQ